MTQQCECMYDGNLKNCTCNNIIISEEIEKLEKYDKERWDDEYHYCCTNFPNCETEGCGESKI